MTGQINAHHGMPLSKVRYLCIPIASITTPAMNKDQSWLAATDDLERYGNPIN
jgi:hypothetical protein